MNTATRIFILALIGFISSCEWQGTDTGNPQRDPDGVSSPVIPETLAEYTQAYVCGLVEDCFGELSGESCDHNILQAPGVAPAYGFPEPHDTLEDIENADLSFNRETAATCLDALDALTCDAPEVLSAYDPRAPEDFDEIHKLFGVSSDCSQVGVSSSN